jgi:hypothetical protein
MTTSLATNGVDNANAVTGGTNSIIFEGPTADGFEIIVIAADGTTNDTTVTIPGDTGAFMVSLLATNRADAANAVWGVSNGLRFEGATANAHEILLQPADATADAVYTLPDAAAATYGIVPSSLATNAVDINNSIWGVTNGLAFGGATGAGGNEVTLQPTDPTGSRIMTIPEMGANSAIVTSLLTTNAADIANSVWFASNAQYWEGTLDAFEIIVTAADAATADTTLYLPNLGGDTVSFFVHTKINNVIDGASAVWGFTNGIAFEGPTADAFEIRVVAADATTADRRVTIPNMGAASALMGSLLTTNRVGAANAVTGKSNGIEFEGATADGSELTISSGDQTVDVTYQFAVAGVADTLAPLASTLETNSPGVANSLWGDSNGYFVSEGTADDYENALAFEDMAGQTAGDALSTVGGFTSDLVGSVAVFTTQTDQGATVVGDLWADSIVINKSSLPAGSKIHVECAGTKTGSNADFNFYFRIDGAAIATLESNMVTAGDYIVEFTMIQKATNVQWVSGELKLENDVGLAVVVASDSTDFTSGPIVIGVKSLSGNGADSIVNEYCEWTRSH